MITGVRGRDWQYCIIYPGVLLTIECVVSGEKKNLHMNKF